MHIHTGTRVEYLTNFREGESEAELQLKAPCSSDTKNVNLLSTTQTHLGKINHLNRYHRLQQPKREQGVHMRVNSYEQAARSLRTNISFKTHMQLC